MHMVKIESLDGSAPKAAPVKEEAKEKQLKNRKLIRKFQKAHEKRRINCFCQ